MDNVFCREYGLLIFSPVGWTLGIYFFCGKLVRFLKLEVRFWQKVLPKVAKNEIWHHYFCFVCNNFGLVWGECVTKTDFFCDLVALKSILSCENGRKQLVCSYFVLPIIEKNEFWYHIWAILALLIP